MLKLHGRMPTASAVKKCPASWIRIRRASPRIATRMLKSAPRSSRRAAAPRRRPRRGRRGRARSRRRPAASVSSTVSAISRNADPPSRKAATATSFAALNAHGNVPPSSPALRASASSGNVSRSGAWNSSVRPAGEIQRRDRRRRPLRVGERVRDRHAHVRIAEMRQRGAVAEADERVHDRGRVDDDLDPLVGRPKRKCASISSRPLLASVAESIVIFGPICQVGCASASLGLTSASSSRVRPRNGPPEAVRTSESTVSGARPSRHWKRCRVLAVDGQQAPASPLPGGERELARGDEALLVREREVDPALERPQRRREAGEADDRVEDDVRLGPLQQLRQVAADLGQRGEPVDRLRARRGRDQLELRVSLDDLERPAGRSSRLRRGVQSVSPSPSQCRDACRPYPGGPMRISGGSRRPPPCGRRERAQVM